jgi:hypothetical protein
MPMHADDAGIKLHTLDDKATFSAARSVAERQRIVAARYRLLTAAGASFGLMLAWFAAREAPLGHDAEYQATLYLMWPRANLGGRLVQFVLLSLDLVVPVLILVLLTAALLSRPLLTAPPRFVQLAYRYALVVPLFAFVATSLARLVSNTIYAAAPAVRWDLTAPIARLEAPIIEALQAKASTPGISHAGAIVYAGGWMLALLAVPLILAVIGRHEAVSRLVVGWILCACLAVPLFLAAPVFEPWAFNPAYGYIGALPNAVRFLAADGGSGELTRIQSDLRWAAGACMPSLHVALPVVVSRICFQQRVPVLGWLFAVFAGVVGVAVVYLGRHWIVDVIAGVGFGVAVAALVSRICPERFLLLHFFSGASERSSA